MTHIFVKKDDPSFWAEINVTDRTYFYMQREPQGLGKNGMSYLHRVFAAKYPDQAGRWIDLADFQHGRVTEFTQVGAKVVHKVGLPVGAEPAPVVMVKAGAAKIAAPATGVSPIHQGYSEDGDPNCTCDSPTRCPDHEYH